jgi:hypothetical protein
MIPTYERGGVAETKWLAAKGWVREHLISTMLTHKIGEVEVLVERNWLASEGWVMRGEELVIQFCVQDGNLRHGGSCKYGGIDKLRGLIYGMARNSWYNFVFKMPTFEKGEVEMWVGRTELASEG